MHTGRNLRVGSQQADVGVKACGVGVVVARGEMGIGTSYSVGIAAYEQGQFAVSLEPHDAMKDLHAGILKIACPADVRCLVKTSHQLPTTGHSLVCAASVRA